MGFWDNVNDELKKAVGGGWTAVKENAKIGKLRLKANSLHKKADKHFSEIGGKVYEISNMGEAKENPLESQEVVQLIEEIRATEEEVREIEAEITKIRRREEAVDKQEAAAEEKPPEERPAEEEQDGKEEKAAKKD